jgi:hypothetical protein
MVSDQVNEATIKAEHSAEARLAQPHRVLDDRIEDRLDAGRRRRDYAQNLARRREVAIASLQLLEQSNVLNGNDRLVREGLKKLDLVVREGPDLHTSDRNGPDRSSLA